MPKAPGPPASRGHEARAELAEQAAPAAEPFRPSRSVWMVRTPLVFSPCSGPKWMKASLAKRYTPWFSAANQMAPSGAWYKAPTSTPLHPTLLGVVDEDASIEARHAAVGADPEVAGRVLHDLVHHVVAEAFGRGVVGEALTVVAAQAEAVGPEPEVAVAGHPYGGDAGPGRTRWWCPAPPPGEWGKA